MPMSKAVSMDKLDSGSGACVIGLRGGRDFQQRIQSMGLSVGSEFEVMHSNGGESDRGGVVVRVGDTRLMIGHGMAQKVIVHQK